MGSLVRKMGPSFLITVLSGTLVSMSAILLHHQVDVNPFMQMSCSG